MTWFIFHANWIYDEVSSKEGTEHSSTYWHGWSINKPLTWCKAQKYCYAPFLWGKVACIGAGSGPADQHSLWQMIQQHCDGGEDCGLFKNWFLWKEKKKGITKFAFNGMYFKTQNSYSCINFSSFSFAWSTVSPCLLLRIPAEHLLDSNQSPLAGSSSVASAHSQHH